MKKAVTVFSQKQSTAGHFLLNYCVLVIPLFLIEALVYLLMSPTDAWALAFGALWALLLAGIVMLLPHLIGRIVYGFVYFAMFAWGIAQAGYYFVFGKMMWMSTISFAGEGFTFFGDIISAFTPLWWIGSVALLLLGIVLMIQFPKPVPKFANRLFSLFPIVASIAALFILPEVVFLRDDKVWGTHSEYAQSSSYRAMYETMYDAHKLYNICGLYQMTFRDVWKHEIYPLTPAYLAEQADQVAQIDEYFAARSKSATNEMTGVFADKNVILVLMESMDDWMITPKDTPTLYTLMEEGINFANFYTPGYGSARTINSEFCMNTGIYLPTTGSYVFDYVTNDWSQSIASQMVANGYTSEVFHYNDPSFYSRGVFEPAMGYNQYNYYADYTSDENALYDDSLLFDIPELNELFFRDGQTFNTIITRSAHLSYVYNEVLSHYALKKYPEYRGMYSSQEEDCARVKAKLVDDMFARLLSELSARGQLENTVIIGMTDHYTYGYKNMEELLTLSGVDQELLLEKTPCFVWSCDGPDVEVTKTLNTSDLLPTVLNLLGIDSPYQYLGQDAFDPNYVGYAIFPDGSWTSDGIFCQIIDNQPHIIMNHSGQTVTDTQLHAMAVLSQEYIGISNLLLTSDYYKNIR